MARLLVLDADRGRRETVARALVRVVPECAVSALPLDPDAIAQVAAECPDTIILGLKTAGPDAFNVCRHLKEEPTTQHIPLIVLAGVEVDPRNKIEALGIGAEAYLTEPIDEAELAAQMKTMLRIRRAEDLLRQERDSLRKLILEINQELQQTEERYQLLFNAGNDAIFVHRMDPNGRPGRLIEVNDVACQRLGYRRTELLERGSDDIVTDRLEDDSHLSQQLLTHGHALFERAIVSKDGTSIPFEMNSQYLKLNGNSHVLTIARDVTDRKRAEHALKTSEARFRELFNSMRNCVAIYRDVDNGQDFVLVDFNQAAETTEHIHKDDVLGKSILHAFPGVRESGLFGALQRVSAVGRPEHLPLAFYSDVRISGWRDTHVFRFLSGELVAVYDDVTDRKRIEDSLRDSEKRNRMLVETMSDGFTIVDEKDTITFANDQFCKMLGYQRDEVVGRTPPDFMDHTDGAAYHEFTDRTRQGRVASYQLEYIRRNRRKVPAIVSPKSILDSSGRYRGSFAVVTDITALKEAETKLKGERASLARKVAERTSELSAANAELTRANRLKDEFLASMSHELRTPLSNILGMAEALEEGVYGGLSERQMKSMRGIEQSGRHLLALINDILDVSKVEAGKLELQIGQVNVESLCQASLALTRQEAQKKRLRMSLSLDSSVATIAADERRLKQVLVNLLNNAVKFTPEGGEIGLECVGDTSAHMVRFTVWDSGVGIDADDLPNLFNPFVQLDSGLSRQHAGTGLGLALVRRLTELHGGGVTVDSRPGGGSRFSVALPLEGTQEEHDQRQEEPSGEESREERVSFEPGGEQKKSVREPLILIAEDNEDNIDIVSQYLRRHRFRVLIAREGTETIQSAQEHDPDLVLMDIQLPGMNGLEVIRRMRESGSLRGIPIIALTALAMPGDRERCLLAGANEYLSKPVSLKSLVETIELYLPDRRT